MNIFQHFFAYLRLREAVRKADDAYCKTAKRHYVLPGADRSLVIADRSNFRILKRKGYIPSKAYISDALLESFYYTPVADGSQRMSVVEQRHRIRFYFRWYAKRLKEEKKRKKEEKIRMKKENKPSWY